MSLYIKICGVTDSLAAQSCAEAGVDAVGFVFASSPRQLTPAHATSIAAVIPQSIAKVAVFRRPTRGEIDEVMAGFTPDLVQADHDTLPEDLPVPVLPVYREGEIVGPAHRRFLYEGPTSGVGRQVDQTRAARVAQHGEMILAGGLRPDNVARAIDGVRPFGVDVSSGVESGPGRKDPALVRSFVEAARAAHERLVRT